MNSNIFVPVGCTLLIIDDFNIMINIVNDFEKSPVDDKIQLRALTHAQLLHAVCIFQSQD